MKSRQQLEKGFVHKARNPFWLVSPIRVCILIGHPERSHSSSVHRSRFLCCITRASMMLSCDAYKRGTKGSICQSHVQHANLPPWMGSSPAPASSVSVRAAVQRSLKISEREEWQDTCVSDLAQVLSAPRVAGYRWRTKPALASATSKQVVWKLEPWNIIMLYVFLNSMTYEAFVSFRCWSFKRKIKSIQTEYSVRHLVKVWGNRWSVIVRVRFWDNQTNKTWHRMNVKVSWNEFQACLRRCHAHFLKAKTALPSAKQVLCLKSCVCIHVFKQKGTEWHQRFKCTCV